MLWFPKVHIINFSCKISLFLSVQVTFPNIIKESGIGEKKTMLKC